METTTQNQTQTRAQPKRIVAQVTAQAITGEAGEADCAIRYDVPPCLGSEMLQRLRASILQLEMRLANDIRKMQEKEERPAGRSGPAFLLYL